MVMRILKNRSWNQKIKFPISLCISFFIGSVLGGVITNLLSRELLEQIGSFDLWYEQSNSLIQNLKKRLGQFMMVCLGGMTGFSGIWFYLVFLVMGAGAGVWIATLTLYGGWKGIFLFAVHMMPQWSCYGTLCSIFCIPYFFIVLFVWFIYITLCYEVDCYFVLYFTCLFEHI